MEMFRRRLDAILKFLELPIIALAYVLFVSFFLTVFWGLLLGGMKLLSVLFT